MYDLPEALEQCMTEPSPAAWAGALSVTEVIQTGGAFSAAVKAWPQKSRSLTSYGADFSTSRLNTCPQARSLLSPWAANDPPHRAAVCWVVSGAQDTREGGMVAAWPQGPQRLLWQGATRNSPFRAAPLSDSASVKGPNT